MLSVSFITFFLLSFFRLSAADVCPSGLDCGAGRCCARANNEQYCCSGADAAAPSDGDNVYIATPTTWWKTNWGLFLGLLIAGIVISIIISVLLCLFCNGCCFPCCYRYWHPGRDGVPPALDVYVRNPPHQAPNPYSNHAAHYPQASPVSSDASWAKTHGHQHSSVPRPTLK